MDISTLWCAEQEFDETGEVICMAHLAEGRVPNCPYKTPLDRKRAEYPCSDYKERKYDEGSNLAKLLGVEEDTEWEHPDISTTCLIHNGTLMVLTDNVWRKCREIEQLMKVIDHPEKIVRTPALTDEELERCRLFHATYISRDPNGFFNNSVKLWSAKPVRKAWGLYVESQETGSSLQGNASCELFPSIHPGECVRVPNLEGR